MSAKILLFPAARIVRNPAGSPAPALRNGGFKPEEAMRAMLELAEIFAQAEPAPKRRKPRRPRA